MIPRLLLVLLLSIVVVAVCFEPSTSLLRVQRIRATAPGGFVRADGLFLAGSDAQLQP
jgi:hypothetical protein